MGTVKVKKMGKKWGIDYSPSRGVRKREVISVRKSDAERVARKKEEELFNNKYSLASNKKIKFKDYAKKYIEEYAAPCIGSGRAKDSEYILERLLPYFGNMYIHEITTYHWDRYRNIRISAKSKKGKSTVKPGTINNEGALLRAMLTRAVKHRELSYNQLEDMELYKVERRDRVATDEEIKLMLSNAKPCLKTFLLIALNTGMRRGEILNLRWNQVDFNNKIITVRNTKSKKPRKIPMNKIIVDLLKRLFSTKGNNQFVIEKPGNSGPYTSISREWYNLMKTTGIIDLRIHDLRHTFATFAIRNGKDVVALKKILGHSDINTTMIYVNILAESQENLINSFSIGEDGVNDEGAPGVNIDDQDFDFSISGDDVFSAGTIDNEEIERPQDMNRSREQIKPEKTGKGEIVEFPKKGDDKKPGNLESEENKGQIINLPTGNRKAK